MPVTVVLEANEPKSHSPAEAVKGVRDLLQSSCPNAIVPETQVVASSFCECGDQLREDVFPSSSSFIRSTIEAWGRHAHLVLRPDDLWFTILIQLNFYMAKNAESVRHVFVPHEGKQYLRGGGNSWKAIIDDIRIQMKDHIRASWLNDWISPGFSTTTEDDERVASVLMMGLMKSFFDYSGGAICGIPSITLLGCKRDWQRLCAKIDRLEDFGDQPCCYAQRLKPILTRIVSTFDGPSATDIKQFWDQIVQAGTARSADCETPVQYSVSGWILGFFYWDSDGNVSNKLSKGLGGEMRRGDAAFEHQLGMQLDDIRYGVAFLDELPVGYAKAKFTFMHFPDGKAIPGWVLAGSIGKRIFDSAPDGYKAAVDPSYRMHFEKEGEAGCFNALLQALGCFSKKHSGHSMKQSGQDDYVEKSEAMMGKEAAKGHSTIQPVSGWFLFYPHDEPGPFYDGDENYGPTVDAIEACESRRRDVVSAGEVRA